MYALPIAKFKRDSWPGEWPSISIHSLPRAIAKDGIPRQRHIVKEAQLSTHVKPVFWHVE